MALIDDLKWRHAVKAYDPTKKVKQEDIDTIVEAMRLAPTSSGLQPFRVLVVSNQELKEKMTPGSLNPDCMKNCSHVIVLAGWERYTDELIDKVYDRTTDERGLPRGRMSSYTDLIKGIYNAQTAEENHAHIARQAYIALGLGLAQAAELKIDTTPAEGFNNQIVDEVLELNKYGLKSVLLMYVGYQDAANNWLNGMKKVRVPKEEFVIEFK